jgi:hypothetical protein
VNAFRGLREEAACLRLRPCQQDAEGFLTPCSVGLTFDNSHTYSCKVSHFGLLGSKLSAWAASPEVQRVGGRQSQHYGFSLGSWVGSLTSQAGTF